MTQVMKGFPCGSCNKTGTRESPRPGCHLSFDPSREAEMTVGLFHSVPL